MSNSPNTRNNEAIDKFESISIQFKDSSGSLYSYSNVDRQRNSSLIVATPSAQVTQNITVWTTYSEISMCSSFPIYNFQYECPNDYTLGIDTFQTTCSTVTINLTARKYFDPDLKATGKVDKVLTVPCTVLYLVNFNEIYSPVPILSTVVTDQQIPTITSFVLIEKYGRYSFSWNEAAQDCYISLTPSSLYNPYYDSLSNCLKTKSTSGQLPEVIFFSNQNNYLVWESTQNEIYSFKLRVLTSNSFCSFEYEFLLAVTGAPMSLENQILILALSFLGMLFVLLALYLWYRREKVKF